MEYCKKSAWTIMPTFSRAAAKPVKWSGNDFAGAVLRERDDLAAETVYLPEQGGCAHAILIGKEFFKGPQSLRDLENFDREADVLQALEGKGLPVPEVTCRGKDTVFYGMTRMPGVELDQISHALSAEEMRILAEDIAGFVIALALALPSKDGTYACHGDLSTRNILVNPQTRRLSAVIDFGSFAYAPEDKLCTGASLPAACPVAEIFAARKAELRRVRQHGEKTAWNITN